MKLIAGRSYCVSVRLSPTKGLGQQHYIRSRLTWCGGGMEDALGHWVGGGVWISTEEYKRKGHGSYCKYYFDLPILGIAEDSNGSI